MTIVDFTGRKPLKYRNLIGRSRIATRIIHSYRLFIIKTKL